MKKIFTFFSLIMLLLFSNSLTFAQMGVGKLSGKVIDADTKEALVGANIIILNTDWGAATDINGNYFILNIPPGTYDVKFSYVGYAPKTIKNVRVVAGITYELNAELSTNFSLPEVVVQDKKLFEEKATNTVKVFDAGQIDRLPVRGVTQIASLQSGVVTQEGSGGVTGNATLNVRGGRGSEVLYIVDGIPQNNLYNGNSVSQVSDNAIDQISFQVGGYEAKYGQAQSGIISITTKSGSPFYSISGETITSSGLDNYGYNLYSLNLSGPIVPGNPDHTIFLSGERNWAADGDPSAININFPSINKTYDAKPNNPASVWRFTGKTKSLFGHFSVYLSANINDNTTKSWDFRKSKWDSQFNDETNNKNYSFSGRVSQTLSANTFWDLTLGYRIFKFKRYLPQLGNNLVAYGDSTYWANNLDVTLAGNGQSVVAYDPYGNPLYSQGQAVSATLDNNGVFRPYGYITGLFQQREDAAMSADFDLTSQIANHLVEIGGGAEYHTVRGYGIYAAQLGLQSDTLSLLQKFQNVEPYDFGYDLTGQTKTNSSNPNQFLRPRQPLIAYAYLQDRFELQDLVLNLGLRMDYFDIKSYELVNPALPFAGGSNPYDFDPGDFKLRAPQVELSPRIGLGFPVTESTVFHAQYGRFVQLPDLNDVYTGPYDYEQFVSYSPQFGQNGALSSEETVQYEVGFRQMFGTRAAINLSAFYKNVKGLVNVQNHFFARTPGGALVTAIYPENADFGTVKGFAFSLDVVHLSYFNFSLQYTYSVAEGTGSSTNSSQTAVFRNLDSQPPKVIAPLSFDQRHTATATLDFFVPEGDLGVFEMLDANFLVSFNSGRPYTPVDEWNLLGDNGIIATTTGYVNSAYGPSNFRIDMKIEKTINIGGVRISPYLWIQNLLNAQNVVSVWRSTGSPSTTGWLNTPEGLASAANNGPGYVQDFRTLENDPSNYGIPRLIRLGLKLDISKL